MRKFFILFFLLCFSSLLFSDFLWQSRSVYQKQRKIGDILTLILDRKNQARFELEHKNQDSFEKQGTQFSGDWLSFPRGELKKRDRGNSTEKFKINSEDSLEIPVMIVAQSNAVFFIEGKSQRKIFDRSFEIFVKGQITDHRIRPSGILFASDLANLYYEISDGRKDDLTLNAEDLIFETNFTDISTNQMISNYQQTNLTVSSNGVSNVSILVLYQTNLTFQTNFSRIELRLKGLKEEKKKEILLRYLSEFLRLIK